MTIDEFKAAAVQAAASAWALDHDRNPDVGVFVVLVRADGAFAMGSANVKPSSAFTLLRNSVSVLSAAGDQVDVINLPVPS